MHLSPPLFLLLLTSLAGPATSQESTPATTTTSTFTTDMSIDPARKPLSAAFMNITFSPSTQPICSHASNASNAGRPSPAALSIAIRTLPQTGACFSMADTFSSIDTTYNSRGTGRCDSSLGLCGIKYTIFGPSAGEQQRWIEDQGWNNVFYTQVRNPLDADVEGERGQGGGRLELEVFSGDDCESGGDGGSARWNCVDGEGTCRGLGFAVRSFRVGLMEAEDVGMGSCDVAAEGMGVGRSGVGWEGVLLGVVGLVVGMWW